jgi:transcriptional regulator of nitric oxide reductase
MIRAALLAALAIAGAIGLRGQSAIDPALESQLRALFPMATAFSPKGGDPPHFKALAAEAAGGSQRMVGVAFWTTELDPLERGYDGPIKILVGVDAGGALTGIVVVDHHEPYGYFSVDLPEFAAQFTGKSLRDPFRVGADIDAVARATMTVGSAARAVRNSARRAATRLLKPPDGPR